ncbi:uncharacterized protein LOC142325721 [Lycorma delicatula]|uniref:uncharacterized protein LOC142325721 n=1 Tax=Lycorma delicatula TaxID=130591 RepID=UPI003F50F7D3
MGIILFQHPQKEILLFPVYLSGNSEVEWEKGFCELQNWMGDHGENRCCLLIGDFNVRIDSDQSTPEELDIGARYLIAQIRRVDIQEWGFKLIPGFCRGYSATDNVFNLYSIINLKIMTAPANNTFINEALPLNKDIKLETEQENVAEMTCFFLPPHVTETDKSSEHDLVQLKEEPLDVINGDIEKDPLAIEETNLVKLENFKVENESVTLKKEVDLEQLKEQSLDVINGDLEKDPLSN